MKNLLERFALQADAFQESFAHMCKSRSVDQLARNFFQVLRGNLLIISGSMYFRSAAEDAWRPLYATNHQTVECHDFFSEENQFGLRYLDHPDFTVCVNQPLVDKSRFGILLGQKLDRSPFSDSDKISLQFFLQQLGGAYQFLISRQKEKQLIFSLNHRVVQLNSLIDTGIEVSRIQLGSKLLSLAMERALALTNASRGMLRISRGRRVVEKRFFPTSFRPGSIKQEGHVIASDFCFGDEKYTFSLYEKESRRGTVRFDETDRLLLDAFVRQVHASLENHYLHQQALEKERIDRDIALAGTIQQKLIPEELPEIPGYQLAGTNIPTKFVGGDFYDCITLKDGRYFLIMADVSGKGVPAGLLVSTLHASAHAYLESPFELTALVGKLNKVIYDASTIDKYITAFFALLDPATGTLESVNAGHNPTYLLRKNRQLEELDAGGIPLGMMGMAYPYQKSHTTLAPGDSLLLYTDGITEAMNEKEEQYDDFRPLKQFLIAQHNTSAAAFLEALLADLNDFTGNTPQSDDITALYVVREAV
jgi:serine phosphatase RsbU (regulator of sigma subunit)